LLFLDKYFNNIKSKASNINKEQYLNYIYGIMFISYIKKSISETRKSYIIRKKKYCNDTPIGEILDSCYYLENSMGSNIQIEDIIQDIEDIRLYTFIKKLSSRQKSILFSYYIQQENEIEISLKLGITKQAVSKMKKKILYAANEYLRKNV
jgi:DNA-directed RNA polymerase specialized sigma subunit